MRVIEVGEFFCVICFVYLGLGREEMRVQRREERKIKINADRVRVMRWVSSEMRVQKREELMLIG